MTTALNDLLLHPGIWRGDGYTAALPEVTDCDHAALAPVLPGGGWPKAAVTEVLVNRAGCGELKLLLPVLARLTQAGQQVVLIAPPHIPYAPAWQAAGVDLRRLTWVAAESDADAQWATEQALRETGCGAVVAWFRQSLSDRCARRLQLAAEQGGGHGFVMRQGAAEQAASPFTLRLGVESVAGGVAVRVLKRRGAPHDRPVFLPHTAPTRQPVPVTAHHAVARAPLSASAARSAASRPYAYVG
ncbi:translesion DNA synthesis-associated protein ImuA [Chitinimonas sp. BJYL2]|uniref:translesion DNA synthesis-associated protein ImuA n=1 Tax=Chitinimonas sp. BJYL2 TaxID=2976696 RepID=UPI0022B3A381|nr:translesion DNA synthesis-associated protein ImuA [Chitinimonas sp. BJYL2]